MMEQSFFFSGSVDDLLFYGWSTHNAGQFVGTCFVIFFVAFLIEAVKLLNVYAALQADVNPLQLGRGLQNETRPAFLRPLVIPASVAYIKRRRFAYKTLGFLCYSLLIMLGYAVMLFVMTYNAWFMIAASLGYTSGYFLFNGLNIFSQPQDQSESGSSLTEPPGSQLLTP